LSSRDRKFVSVEIVWLGQSPGHRRLRFSFQFNDVKDRDCLSAAPLFSAGGRRRRLSSGRPLSCQSVLSDFFAGPWSPRNLAAKIAMGRRGASLMVSVAIRLRLGKIARSKRKARGLSPLAAASFWPRPSGRRLSMRRSAPCQSAFRASSSQVWIHWVFPERLRPVPLTDPLSPHAERRDGPLPALLTRAAPVRRTRTGRHHAVAKSPVRTARAGGASPR
jgi:hypothetical protein